MTMLAPYGDAGLRPTTPLWLVGACVALALHGVVAAAILTFKPDEADDDIGAPTIEMAMDMAAPKTEPSDLPPGPEADAAAASPESARSAARTEAADAPKEQPVEAENPDRDVSPETTKRPEPEPEKEKPRPSEASTPSVASEATAAPTQDVKTQARVAVAPTIGVGQSTQQVRATWQKRLFAHLSRNKRYPAGVRQHQAENRVVFTLDRTGRVVSARISATSGDPAFDTAALDMMKRSDPVPAPPPSVADETLTFEIPVVFRAPGH